MSTNETLVAVTAIIAIVFIFVIFLFLFRKKKLAVRARLPLGTEVSLEGNPQSPRNRARSGAKHSRRVVT